MSRRLQFRLMSALEETGIALVFDTPIDLLLSPTTVVQPDLVIVRKARKALVTKRAIEGVPDLVIEIHAGTVALLRIEPGAAYALYCSRADPRASTHGKLELTSPEFPDVSIALGEAFAEH